MKNVEELKQLAAEAIANRPNSTATHYELCMCEGGLACMPKTKCVKHEPVFMVLEELHLTKGLSNNEWNHLGKRLANYWKEFKT